MTAQGGARRLRLPCAHSVLCMGLATGGVTSQEQVAANQGD